MDDISNPPTREDTLHRLINEFEIPIRRMCWIYLRDAHLADDAVQETFLKAYQGLDAFRRESSEKTWLMRIALNVCHSMRRTGWMRFIDHRITLDQLPEPAVPANYGMIDLMLDIMRLPQKYIDVVMLCDYQGFTVRQAGEILGIPHQTIISRRKKAHELLRISLEGGTQK